MKYFKRVYPKDAMTANTLSEIPSITKKWWKSSYLDETFPGGYIPIFYTLDDSVKGILDKDLCIVSANKPWTDFKTIGYFICAKFHSVEKARKKYSGRSGWNEVEWSGKLK